MEQRILAGGVTNAGSVVRAGAHVLRPAGPHAPSIHALLAHLRAVGFVGAPEVVGVDQGTHGKRERLAFIAGEVPVPPYPAWSRRDRALVSTVALLRRCHDAAASFAPTTAASWSRELADPQGGPLICHNDVCPENVVFRDGVAAALLDFDFAAPGRPVWDLAQLAKLWLPLRDPRDVARLGRDAFDAFDGLRAIADAYGLPRSERSDLVEAIGDVIAVGDRFVRVRVARGEPAFVAMWERLGGSEGSARRRAWFERVRGRLLDAALG